MLVCGFVIAGVVAGNMNRAGAVAGPEIVSPTPRRTPRRTARTAPTKYVDFPHSAKAHQIACDNCHKFPSPNWNKVRNGDAAFPDITDYPQHQSCVGCHKAQFFRGNPPQVCSICHTNPGPRDSSRHPFPNPKEIFDQSPKGKVAFPDFSVQFPHDKHIDIVSSLGESQEVFAKAAYISPRRRAAEESCSVCHKTLNPQGEGPDEYFVKPPEKLGDAYWLKKGTFKTIPTGHTTCFQCHNADSGLAPAPTDCATCHKLKAKFTPDFDPKLAATMTGNDKTTIDLWRNRVSAGAFRHEFASHAEMECAMCHVTIKTMNTADPKSRKVEISACATCHVTATVDDGGAVNYEVDARKKDPKFQCAKCHVAFGKLPIPDSHTKAIAEAGK